MPAIKKPRPVLNCSGCGILFTTSNTELKRKLAKNQIKFYCTTKCSKENRTKYDIAFLKKFAEEKGGRCLSTKYFGWNKKHEWQCKENHNFNSSARSVIAGKCWCKHCANNSMRIPIENVVALIKTKGGELLSKTYENCYTKILVKCSKFHTWETTWSDLKDGRWCNECHLDSIRCSIYDARELARMRNGHCLTVCYINSKTHMVWCCNQMHIWSASYERIASGTWCPRCAGKNKTIDDIQKIAIDRGGKCLSLEFLSNKETLYFKCAKRHIFELNYDDLCNANYPGWCPYCSGRRRTVEDLHLAALKNNGRCLSKEYISAITKYTWLCEKYHIWEAHYNNIKQGKWCPYCAGSRGEELCREIFQEIFNQRFNKIRPDWLVGDKKHNLELDGYCAGLNLAFEYNGKQHYEEIDFYHTTKDRLDAQQERDRVKNTRCKEVGIKLITIKYIEVPTKDKLKIIITDLLKQNNVFTKTERIIQNENKAIPY